MRTPFLCACAALAPITGAAQEAAPADGLARARAVYASADRDGNARLTLQEVRDRQIAVTDREFREEDFDRDGAWSLEEFTVHYRTILLRSGGRPAADLEAEVVRVLALRRARTVDESRSRQGPAAGRLADRTDPAWGATPESLELDARIERALSDLQDRAAGRGAVRADFDRVRALWNERLTLVRGLGDASSATAELGARFLRALDGLEARARAGSVARGEFVGLRAAWDARSRRVVTPEEPKAGAPSARADDRAAGPTIETRFERGLAEVEAKVFARVATRADWAALRELVPDRARRLVQGAGSLLPSTDDVRVVRTVAELNEVLDRMELRASNGSIGRTDFQELRARLTPEKPRESGPSDREPRR